MRNFKRSFEPIKGCFANPGPASTNTDHPIGGGGGPAYVGTSGSAIGFYQDPFAGGAVTQRASAFQQVLTVSQTSGFLVNFQANSQAHPAITAQMVTNANILCTGAPQLSTADVVIVNKQVPIAQYGIASVRVSIASVAQNTCVFVLGAANFGVSGAATVTASADQWIVTALRGSVVNSVTLTPSPVPANTCAEQQFTVTGLAPGMVVPIVKPTEQANLGIVGTRVVSNNVLGINFLNMGNTAITPTASEVYKYVGLAGIASTVPLFQVGLNMSQVATITVTGQTVTYATAKVTGINSTDMVVGTGQNVLPDQPQLFLAGARVSANSSNYMQLGFVNMTVSTTPVTANSTDTYIIPVARPDMEAPMTLYQVPVAATTIGPNTCTEIGVTVTGITVSCAVHVTKPTATAGLGILGYRVSQAGAAGSTIGITFGNPTSASISVPAETYTVAAFKPLFGVGHYTQQMVSPYSVAGVQLLNELRNALAGTGFIAGS